MTPWMLIDGGAVQFRKGGSMEFLCASPDVLLWDIARALSRMFRSGGRREWSVAQHSLLVSRHVPPELELAALVHDIEEPFTGDMPKPWVDSLPSEMRLELQRVRDKAREEILAYLGIDGTNVDHPAIKRADAWAFAAEVHFFDEKNLDKAREWGLTVPLRTCPGGPLVSGGLAASSIVFDGFHPSEVACWWFVRVQDLMIRGGC